MSSAPATFTLRYQLIAQIGEGSMGAVFRAHDRLSGHDVALKHVTLAISDADEDPEVLRLALAHEFRILAGLRHPHIINVLDYGFDRERQPFFTMDLLEGAQSILTAGQSAAQDTQAIMLIEALEALAYLHRRGVLHHDLKPENVLVVGGRVRVLDFGLATLASQPSDDDAFGTFLYLAPEVLSGGRYTEQSDLYSLGVIAYELLIGQHPFQAENVSDFLQQVRMASPDLSALAEQPQLAALLGQLLAKSPSERPASTQAVIEDLRRALGRSDPVGDQAIRESYLQAAAFVGRERERDSLSSALTRAAEGNGSTWLIGGESGVGKSRLLDELRIQALVQGFQVLRGQAVEGGGLPYQLWRDPLRQLVLQNEPNPLDAGVLLEIVPDIGNLLGQAVAAAPPLNGAAHQERLWLTISAQLRQPHQPTLLILDDLQWSAGSLEPLKRLIASAPQHALCIIGSYRSDEQPELPNELPEPIHQLQLERLHEHDIVALAGSMLGEQELAPQVVELLQRETEGNVFFLVEMVRALAEEAGTFERIRSMSLPRAVLARGVQALLQRRLRRMPDWGRELLQLAALAGRQLDLRLLAQVRPAVDQERWLNAGAAAAIFEVSDEHWRFSHDKLREAAIAELPEDMRRALHRALALGIEAIYPGQISYAQVLYDQWCAAGERVRALPYAADLASQQLYSIPANSVTAQIDAALAGLDDTVDPASQSRLWRLAGEAQQDLGNLDRATQALERSLRIAELLADPSYRADALISLARLMVSRSAYDQAIQFSTTAIGLVEQTKGYKALAFAHNNCGLARLWRAEYEHAQVAFEQALHYAQLANNPGQIAIANNNLGIVANYAGDLARASSYYEHSLTLSLATGNRRAAFSALNNLGLLANGRFDDQQAQQYYSQALAVAREMGNHEQIATVLVNLGSFYSECLELDTAERYLTEGLTIARRTSDHRNEFHCLNNLATCQMERGAFDAARELLAQAQAIVHTHDIRQLLPTLYRALGALARAQADWGEAEQAYTTGLDIALEQGDQLIRTDLFIDRALNCWLQGDLAAAQADLEQAQLLAQAQRSPHTEATILAYRALVQSRHGELAAAQQLIDAASRLAGPHALIQAPILAAQAYLHACTGAYSQSLAICTALEAAPTTTRFLREMVLAPLKRLQA